jgi:hypothetical protein
MMTIAVVSFQVNSYFAGFRTQQRINSCISGSSGAFLSLSVKQGRLLLVTSVCSLLCFASFLFIIYNVQDTLRCKVFSRKPSMDQKDSLNRILCIPTHVCSNYVRGSTLRHNTKISSVTIPGLCWLSAHLQNVLISAPSLFLFSFGQHSCTIPLLTGHGTPTVGARSLEISILQEAPQSIYLLEVRHSRFHFT